MSACAPLASAPTPASSEVIDGQYEIVRPVWVGRASQLSEVRELSTGRMFVVKTARIDGVNVEGGRDRVRRTARALTVIRNDLVVATIAAGECSRVGPYVVMERLIGRSLEGLLASRRELDVPAAVHVLRSVASALAAVHRHGFSHGDVRPGNVFVSQWADGMDRLKLIDFGLAAPLTSRDVSARMAAVRDGSCGAYWAPEVVAGISAGDERSDLYALGLVALEALGARPLSLAARFGTPDVASKLFAERRDVPADVVTLLDALLATDPHARPPTAAMVLDHLPPPPEGAAPRLLLGYQRSASSTVAQAPAWLPAAGSRQDLRAVNEHDRRGHPRAPYITPMRLIHGRMHIDGRSEDISATGALVVTSASVSAVEGPLHLRFALPTTGATTTVPVAARWVQKAPHHTAIGLEFLRVEHHVTEAIATYLKYFAVPG